MLARRWRWSCVYVAANLVAFGLSFFAGRPAGLWLFCVGWLLSVGYVIVIFKTRTRRGPWGSRLRGEVERPQLWRTARSLSLDRRGGDNLVARSDALDTARRDASDWLSGIGLTTLSAIVFLLPGVGSGAGPGPPLRDQWWLCGSHLLGTDPGSGRHGSSRSTRYGRVVSASDPRGWRPTGCLGNSRYPCSASEGRDAASRILGQRGAPAEDVGHAAGTVAATSVGGG